MAGDDDFVVADSEDEDSMIMKRPEDDPMNGQSNAHSTIGNFTTMSGQASSVIDTSGNSTIPQLDGPSSAAPAPPKPRPRPRPVPRKSKPSDAAAPADTSVSTTSASSIHPVPEPIPEPTPAPELDLSYTLGVAERAKLRNRRVSKPAPLPVGEVIDISSDDELALPAPRATKKAKTKHATDAGVGDTTLDSISAAHIPLPSSSLPPSSPFPSQSRAAKRKRPTSTAEEGDAMPPPMPPAFFDTTTESFASELPGADSSAIASGSASVIGVEAPVKEKKKAPRKKKVIDDEEDWDAPIEEPVTKKKGKKKAADDDDEEAWDDAPKKKKKDKAPAKKAPAAAAVEGEEGTAPAKKKAPRKRKAVEVSLPPAAPAMPEPVVQDAEMSFVPPSVPDRAPSSDPGEEDELRLPDFNAPSPPPAPAPLPEPELVPEPVTAPAKKKRAAKGQGKEKAAEPTEDADDLEVAPPKKSKKAAKRAVIGSDDEEPAPAPATKKGGKKGSKKAAPVPAIVEDVEMVAVEDAVERHGSASVPGTPTKRKENLQPSPSNSTHEPPTSSASGSALPPPRTPAPRPSMNRESSALPPSYIANKAYSIARSKSGVSDLLRRTSSPASKAYSPYSKMSKTVLRKFAPLHPNRRTPPPPPPPPPPKKKTKKELDREEKWEEELEDEVEGWYALGEEERARWRRAKREKELGYDD